MLAVAVARGAGESEDDDVGAEAADIPDYVSQDFFARPMGEGVLGSFGEAEVDGAGEELFTSVDFSGSEELLSTDDAECVALFRSDQVLAAFSSGEGKIGGAEVAASGEISQKGRIFIVGMGADHHHAAQGFEFFQALVKLGLAGEVFLGLKGSKQNADP